MNEWMSVQCVLHYTLSVIQLTFRVVVLHGWMNEWMSLQCVLHYNVLPKYMSIYVFYFILIDFSECANKILFSINMYIPWTFQWICILAGQFR